MVSHPFMHQQVFNSYWARSDVLEPLAHVGAILYCGAASLLPVPTTIWVSGTQTRPGKHRQTQVTLVSRSLLNILPLKKQQVLP